MELDRPLERLRHAAAAARVSEQRCDRGARRARGGGDVEQLLVDLQGGVGCREAAEEARDGASRGHGGCRVGAEWVMTCARDLFQVSASVNFPLSYAAHSARQTAG